MTASKSVSLTLIEATGVTADVAIADGETVTPVPVLTVTAGVVATVAITAGLTVTPAP
jgi:hypothetical protein